MEPNMSAKMRTVCKLSLSVAIFCILSFASSDDVRANCLDGIYLDAVHSTAPLRNHPLEAHHRVPEDWTHHHLVFSHPGTLDDAEKNGTVDQWFKITSDARYQIQQMKRNAMQRTSTGARASSVGGPVEDVSSAASKPGATKKKQPVRTPLSQDWSMEVGASGGASLTAVVGTTINASTIPSRLGIRLRLTARLYDEQSGGGNSNRTRFEPSNHHQ